MKKTHFMIWILWWISAVVAMGLYQNRNMWKFIVAYWAVLALKNFIDAVNKD